MHYSIALSCMRVLCRQVQSCCRCAAKPVPGRFTGSLCRIALHSLDLRSLYASMYRALVAASAFGRERALSASPQADVMPHRSTLGRLAACATVAGKYMLPALRAFTAECIALGDCEPCAGVLALSSFPSLLHFLLSSSSLPPLFLPLLRHAMHW